MFIIFLLLFFFLFFISTRFLLLSPHLLLFLLLLIMYILYNFFFSLWKPFSSLRPIIVINITKRLWRPLKLFIGKAFHIANFEILVPFYITVRITWIQILYIIFVYNRTPKSTYRDKFPILQSISFNIILNLRILFQLHYYIILYCAP